MGEKRGQREAMVLSLNAEEQTTVQGIWRTSRSQKSQKRQGNRFSPRASGKNAALMKPSFQPIKPVLNFLPVEIQDNKCVVFKSPRLWYFVTVIQKTNTIFWTWFIMFHEQVMAPQHLLFISHRVFQIIFKSSTHDYFPNPSSHWTLFPQLIQ